MNQPMESRAERYGEPEVLLLSSRQGEIRRKSNEKLYLHLRRSPVNQNENNEFMTQVCENMTSQKYVVLWLNPPQLEVNGPFLFQIECIFCGETILNSGGGSTIDNIHRSTIFTQTTVCLLHPSSDDHNNNNQ